MYLASRSPQRQALLEALGLDFEVVPPTYDEQDQPGMAPAALVERHSRGKALAVFSTIKPLDPKRPVLGVDTMVAVGGEAMGKAVAEDEAAAYLRRLSGVTHEVFSGVTLITAAGPDGIKAKSGKVLPEFYEQAGHAVTEVRFSELSEVEIAAYIATGEWRQRAGAYAIQGRASAFVEEVRGDYTNVVGLPVPLLVRMLKGSGLWPPPAWTGP